MCIRDRDAKVRRVLSLCDGLGSWSQPYREAGYDVVAVDTLQGQDVRLLAFSDGWHGILAAPPCTHFAGSGARWWKAKGESKLLEGLSVVCLLYTSPSPTRLLS